MLEISYFVCRPESKATESSREVYVAHEISFFLCQPESRATESPSMTIALLSLCSDLLPL